VTQATGVLPLGVGLTQAQLGLKSAADYLAPLDALSTHGNKLVTA